MGGDWVSPPKNLIEAESLPAKGGPTKMEESCLDSSIFGANDDNDKRSSQIEAQRSGFDLERRSDGVNERWRLL